MPESPQVGGSNTTHRPTRTAYDSVMTTDPPDPAAPTELAGVASADTESAFAWAEDDGPVDYPEDFESRRRRWPTWVTAGAVAASLAIVGGAAWIAVPYLWGDSSPAPASSPAAPTRMAGDPDTRLVEGLRSKGWVDANPDALIRDAHLVCSMLRQGAPVDYINRQYASDSGQSIAVAETFTSTVMDTYPNCP